MCRNRHVVSVLSDDENIFPDAACIQYAARHHSLWMVCGLEQYFLPTCRGICVEVSQEGSPGYHFFAHLPQYLCKSESGGPSEVSFSAHLAWYCGKSVSGDTLNALPAAIFAGERVRWSVRGVIFSRHPRKTEQTVRGGQSCAAVMPAPPREKNPAGANLSVRPRIPLSSSPLCPRQRRGEVPGGSDPAKKYEKKLRKIWRFGKKQYLCNPVRKEGCPGGSRGEAGE